MNARFARAGALLLAAGCLFAAPVPAARAAPRHATPTLLLEPFDLFDTSIDHRGMVVAAQKRWLHDATAAMRRKLDAGRRVHVIDDPASRKMNGALVGAYQHPSTCRSCALADARKLGAQYVFIGSVHKVSDLIIYMRGELDSVRGGKPLMVKSMEVKADDKTMVTRGAATMAAAIERHIRPRRS